MDGNKNNGRNKFPIILESDFKDNLSLKFGWGRFRPACLQFLNSPKWFLAGIVLYTFCQVPFLALAGIILLGLTYLTLPSLEKRFSLSGKEMGIIVASSDISALLVLVFISFYGDYGNKIRWIGGGGLIVGLGAFCYTLPHFLIGPYQPTSKVIRRGLCHAGQTKCNLESDSQWYYLLIFVLSQLMCGAGNSPFYSLVPAYLDENVHPKSMPVYLGTWTFANTLGPGLGLIIGGKILSIYVDLKQLDTIHLTARDPRWIGAWWLGFLVFGFIILVSSLLVLGFPRELPGAKERRQKHINKGNLRKANNLKKPSLKKILPELKNLLTNWTFVFNTLGLTSTLLYFGAVAPFIPKILQMKFGLKPENTGYALALMVTPTTAIGTFLGSIILKQFSLKDVCKNAALFIVIIRTLGFLDPLSYLIPGCVSVNLAGLSTPYDQTVAGDHMQDVPSVQKVSLKTSCNINCGCSLSRFAPVCGSDNITYFDSCHAGCTVSYRNKSIKTFANCSCIPSQPHGSGFGSARFGYCDRNCKNLILFSGMLATNVMLQYMKVVPDKTVTLRCVPDNKRAFASGVQYMSWKTLGFLPGPILFGHILDSYCRLWQDTCGKKGRCFDYDIDGLSYAVCIMGCTISLISITFYFFSWYLYKPENQEERELGASLNVAEAIDPGRETNL